MLYPNPCYKDVYYKGAALYLICILLLAGDHLDVKIERERSVTPDSIAGYELMSLGKVPFIDPEKNSVNHLAFILS